MKKQAYLNHKKAYPLHHFIFYPVTILLLVFAIWQAFKQPGDRSLWAIMAAGIFLLALLSFMTRQHYALILQNRLVRLEMRFRYYQLTGKRLEVIEAELGFGRLAALRFCSDNELSALIERTLKEKLTANEIKKSIKEWYPDHMRV